MHLWDIRQPDRPKSSFCSWTVGANQVKFNRLNEWTLATSHDTDVRIWDIRMGSAPTTLITAHMKKINGIDWSRRVDSEILTCSQDGSIKLWDINSPDASFAEILTGIPIWRARYTPFGNGVVSMPQRKDNNLYLWDMRSGASNNVPVHTFSGHFDTPTEFVWRFNRISLSEDESDYQLITWSKDNHLRMWPVTREVTKVFLLINLVGWTRPAKAQIKFRKRNFFQLCGFKILFDAKY